MAATTTIRILPTAQRQFASMPFPMIPASPGYEHLTRRERLDVPAVAGRDVLLQRLQALAQLAPDAPLSFLVVHIGGLGQLRDAEAGQGALAAITGQIAELTGPLDLAGRIGPSEIGIVLQGRGTRAAAALASRLQWCLQRLPELARPLYVEVYAATGTGQNAMMLPMAAADWLPDVG